MISQEWSGTGKFLVPLVVGLLAGLVGLVVLRRRDITP
jgi:hypothetical protein